MRTFKDLDGRQWEISLNLANAMKLRNRFGADLFTPEVSDIRDLDENAMFKQIGKLVTDPLRVAEITLVLLESQFEKAGVDAEYVMTKMDGSTVKAIRNAFLDEYGEFLAQQGSEAVAKIFQKAKETYELADRKGAQAVDGLDVAKAVEESIGPDLAAAE